MNHNEETICIEIAAFRETELMNTIHSALIQADNPDRLHFAVCYQNDDLKDYHELVKLPNCRIQYFRESETKGLCFARNECQKLVQDETYILQIDSHMRFVKHWDNKMIEQLLSTNDPKGAISFYPSNCLEDMMKLPLDDPLFDEPCDSNVLYARSFKEYPSYFVNFASYPKSRDEGTTLNPFISGGNFFSFREVHQEVWNDPGMYFYGDELAMGIRLYTYGWNIYVPNEGYIYHQFERPNRKFPHINNAMKLEEERLRSLLRIGKHPDDLGEYGFGPARTLEQYSEFCGIDFQNRKIYMTARTGFFDREDYRHVLAFTPPEDIESYKKKIEVLLVDPYGSYEDCIQSCLEHSDYKNRIRFIIGTVSQKEPSVANKYIKEVMHFEPGTTYCQILSDISQKIGNSFVAIVDSSFRFIDSWDQYYCNNLFQCGELGGLVSWIWCADSKDKAKEMFAYNNVVQLFDGFHDNMPIFKFDEKIVLEKMEHPFPAQYMSSGFLFCKAKLLKHVPIDPNLDFAEHRAVYPVRLWTHGINIYYPKTSYFVRTVEESTLSNNIRHYPVLCYMFQQRRARQDMIPMDYPYLIGNKTPLWAYFEFLGYKPE